MTNHRGQSRHRETRMSENHPSAGDHTDPSRVARHFLSALESMDIDAALSCFADSAVQEMPFAPPGFPTRLEGMDALRRQYGGLPRRTPG